MDVTAVLDPPLGPPVGGMTCQKKTTHVLLAGDQSAYTVCGFLSDPEQTDNVCMCPQS